MYTLNSVAECLALPGCTALYSLNMGAGDFSSTLPYTALPHGACPKGTSHNQGHQIIVERSCTAQHVASTVEVTRNSCNTDFTRESPGTLGSFAPDLWEDQLTLMLLCGRKLYLRASVILRSSSKGVGANPRGRRR